MMLKHHCHNIQNSYSISQLRPHVVQPWCTWKNSLFNTFNSTDQHKQPYTTPQAPMIVHLLQIQM